MMDTRKRGRPDFGTNGYGGFKKSKQGQFFLLISISSNLISLITIWVLCGSFFFSDLFMLLIILLFFSGFLCLSY
jgi:hypothetical protein